MVVAQGKGTPSTDPRNITVLNKVPIFHNPKTGVLYVPMISEEASSGYAPGTWG